MAGIVDFVRRGAAFTISLAALLSGTASAGAAELAVTIENLRSTGGNLMIGLYDSDDAFAKAPDLYDSVDGFLRDRERVVGMAIRVDSGVRAAVFGGLAPGRYAVIVFHDVNANGQFDRRFFVPVEPYGFSNDARGFLRGPSFEAASIGLGEERKEVVIHLTR